MGLLFFSIVFFTTSIVYSQEKLNQFDENGLRTGIWKKFYANKNIRYQGQFNAGKEVGTFKYYSALSSKHPVIIKEFNKNNDTATVSFYTIKGTLKSTGFMVGKNREGTWLYYHKEGKTLISEENFENGLKNGVAKTYYKNGKLTEIFSYKNNKLHGNFKRYAINGVLIDDLNYINGQLNGFAKYFNIKGELIYAGNYENDVKIGKWEYFENGKPVKTSKNIRLRH